jgi:hypothetical protein
MKKMSPKTHGIMEFVRGARAAVLIAISIFLLMIAIAELMKAQTRENQRTDSLVIENEHRFTTLETRLDSIQGDIKDLKQYNWVVYSALAGLAGESALRILKKKNTEE